MRRCSNDVEHSWDGGHRDVKNGGWYTSSMIGFAVKFQVHKDLIIVDGTRVMS